jgi:hypothetical protein
LVFILGRNEFNQAGVEAGIFGLTNLFNSPLLLLIADTMADGLQGFLEAVLV